MAKRPFNGSPTVDGYYTTFDSSEVHRIDSSDEGGGSSSDFSTATVTLVNNYSMNADIQAALVGSEVQGTYTLGNVDTNTTATFNVILYNGCAFALINTEGEYSVEVEGDAEVDGSDIIITGDCTITIS